MSVPTAGVARLGRLGVVSAQGEDAARFLHGQLTQDVALLGPDEVRLAALCSPKGRMLASMVVIRQHDEEILLVMSADLVDAICRRLQMFVLRAKVKLAVVTGQWAVYGQLGPAGPVPARPWARARFSGDGRASAISLYPAEGVPRTLWVMPSDQPAPAGPPLDENLWQWTEVLSGVVAVTQPVSDAFVPQMLNYESVGGVSFKKGCYPGQEVVARSQFRGTLKRRAYRLVADAPVAAGDEVFHPDDPEQPAGVVAMAAPDPSGAWWAVASIQTAAAGDAPLQIGSGRIQARLQPLPYPLLDDI